MRTKVWLPQQAGFLWESTASALQSEGFVVVNEVDPSTVEILDLVETHNAQHHRLVRVQRTRLRLVVTNGAYWTPELLRLEILGLISPRVPLAEFVSAVRIVAEGKRYLVGEFLDAALASAETSVELTPRESELVKLAAEGLSEKQMAMVLGVTLKTTASHLQNAYRKLDVHNRVELARRAVELGLVEWRKQVE